MSLHGTLRSPLTLVCRSARVVRIGRSRWSRPRPFSVLSSTRQQERGIRVADPDVTGAYNHNDFTPVEATQGVPLEQDYRSQQRTSTNVSEAPEGATAPIVSWVRDTTLEELDLPTATAIQVDSEAKLFDHVYLRDSCQCPLCVDPSTSQKLFQTSDIPSNITPTQCLLGENGSPQIQWANDIPGYPADHTSTIPISLLENPARTSPDEALYSPGVEGRTTWNRDKMAEENRFVLYSDYMRSDVVLYRTLDQLNKYGLVFLKDCPNSEKAVERIISRIGTLRDSFYGRTWDVKSKPDAKNIAYTHQFLGMHMDLLYMTNPPHLQLLHSLRARAPGGASMFSDSFAAATALQHSSPDLFETLTTYPVHYHYHNDGHHYRSTRPTVELNESGTIRRVNWSPPFQAPLSSGIYATPAAEASPGEQQSPLRQYLAAASALQKHVEAETSIFEHRLNEGECVIFDNRRVLHARRAFEADRGERWLKGAYVDDDVFFSKLRVLGENFRPEGVVRKTAKGKISANAWREEIRMRHFERRGVDRGGEGAEGAAEGRTVRMKKVEVSSPIRRIHLP
ncbi:hypothetical protein W97_01273 [Coniosporium apollinis CBS 100218]|uniref:TauD/TfdA-like domain-containing protein n=1 Tax=Coniosporium apollinis (strain CBS 100218) TaxID=1168221 RepID=R7YJQ8_CONA1|nr:uncharacterized protein W97_01273 [Coniosporium apollinis CBS 100218]EON62054.1 hypothetical protein W97_01273 [Coniosporium apollinis CBS 100218]